MAKLAPYLIAFLKRYTNCVPEVLHELQLKRWPYTYKRYASLWPRIQSLAMLGNNQIKYGHYELAQHSHCIGQKNYGREKDIHTVTHLVKIGAFHWNDTLYEQSL